MLYMVKTFLLCLIVGLWMTATCSPRAYCAASTAAVKPANVRDPLIWTVSKEQPVLVTAGDTVRVTGSTDDFFVTRIILEADRQLVDCKDGDGKYDLSWTTKDAHEGLHILDVIEMKGTGRWRLMRIPVTIVSQEPISIKSPLPGEEVVTTVSITSTAAPIYANLPVELTVNGKVAGTIKPGEAYSWDVSQLPPGKYDLQIQAKSGDICLRSLCVSVNVPERISILTPTKGQHLSFSPGKQTTLLSAAPNPKAGAKEIVFLLDGREIAKSILPSTSTEWKVNYAAQGLHGIVARLVDASGRIYDSKPVSVSFDFGGEPISGK